jgi:Fe-S cluster assembly protein SufD
MASTFTDKLHVAVAASRSLAATGAAASANLVDAVVDTKTRDAALALLLRDGLPNNRDENWRYANLRALERVAFTAVSKLADVPASSLPAALPDYRRYVFVDGLFAASLSAPLEATAGLTIRVSAQAAERGAQGADVLTMSATSRGGGVETSDIKSRDRRFAQLNEALAYSAISIDVAAQARIEVLYVSTIDGSTAASYPRLAVHTQAESQLELIERHISIGAAAGFVNSVVNLELARGSKLHHVRVQDLGLRSLSFETLSARLEAHAVYRLSCIAVGSLAARATAHVQLAGRGARCEISAATASDSLQTIDSHVEIEHLAPDTVTREIFRGIATGRSKLAFNGKIIVRPEAHNADSAQSLKTLLAGKDAEIAVRPQLEIYTNRVRATHGATAGKLDEDMLFYLLARGIDRDTAQALLKWAFIEDALVAIEPLELRRAIERRLAGQFRDIAALDELLNTAPISLDSIESAPQGATQEITP